MAEQIQHKRGSAAAWTSANTVLADGQIGIEKGAVTKFKIGNGSTPWNTLPYFGDQFEPAIAVGNNAQYMRGDKTFQDLGVAVRSVVLSGFAVGQNVAVVATDTISGAIGKLQAQSNAKLANPMTTAGDIIYGGALGTPNRLGGETTNTKKFLTSQGAGGVAQAPVWSALAASDIPTLNQSTTGQAGSVAQALSISAELCGQGNVTYDGSVARSLNIQPASITNSMLANMPTMTIKGNNAGTSGIGMDLTVTQVTAMLNTFTATQKGLVPAPVSPQPWLFLRADGAWAMSGDVTTGGTQIFTGVNTFSPTVNPTSAVSRAVVISPTLNATANNDTLVALDIKSTYNKGAFTGVGAYALRLDNEIRVNASSNFPVIMNVRNFANNADLFKIEGNSDGSNRYVDIGSGNAIWRLAGSNGVISANGLVTFNHTTTFTGFSASAVPITINAKASQTAALVAINSSGGSGGNLFRVAADGGIFSAALNDSSGVARMVVSTNGVFSLQDITGGSNVTLYTTTGENVDGAMTQAAVTTALANKADAIDFTYKPLTFASPTTDWAFNGLEPYAELVSAGNTVITVSNTSDGDGGSIKIKKGDANHVVAFGGDSVVYGTIEDTTEDQYFYFTNEGGVIKWFSDSPLILTTNGPTTSWNRQTRTLNIATSAGGGGGATVTVSGEYLESETPSAPATGVKLFAKKFGDKQLTSFINAQGEEAIITPNPIENVVQWLIFNGTTVNGMGFSSNGTSAATAVTVSIGNALARRNRVRFATGTTAGAKANASPLGARLERSTTAGLGGWICINRFGITAAPTDCLFFSGLIQTNFTPPNTGDPSGWAVPLIGIGRDATDTNFQLMHKATSGATPTKVDTGIPFVASDSILYTTRFTNNVAEESITVELLVFGTTTVFKQKVTTNIPAAWMLFNIINQIGNNASAAQAQLEMNLVYVESNVY